MTTMLEVLDGLLRSGDLDLVEEIDLPARSERRLEIPGAFEGGQTGEWLRSQSGTLSSLWYHQSLALDHIAAGENVVVATGTASGKSLVFQAAALRRIEQDPDARVIVFYPLIALAGDQLVSWRQAAMAVGLPASIVGQIHGGVLEDERVRIVREARIIAMTPDVCHAWLMRNSGTIDVRRFLRQLRMVILDEAHVLEAVFGSNVAFLLRRLQVVCALAQRNHTDVQSLQFVAASATISNPGSHLRSLTGKNFQTVDETADGSPTFSRRLLHIAQRGDAYEGLRQILRELVEQSNTGSFIAFADSRQGVERIATNLGHDGVRPYRSGYELEDRQRIESDLRSAALRGVVSTSALELGINISHFTVGLTLDVPNSRKAFRQRIGRIGRAQPGAFVVLAEPFAFRRLGSTFAEYWTDSVEPSHLYLDNRFMQYAHARCLSDELEVLDVVRPVPPANIHWPNGYQQIFEYSRPGGARPREFDQIQQIGGDEPHRNYPLRNIGEPTFTIARSGDPGTGRVGTINLQYAIREAYPGAVYLHMMRAYKVYEWRNTNFDRNIRVGNWSGPAITRPFIRTFVNAALDAANIVDGHYRLGPSGFLAECHLQINERVEGYYERGEKRLYKDLRQQNPAMSPKTRDFRTTGVLIRITEEWFKSPGMKQYLANALHELVVREYSISPRDVSVTATNIAIVDNGQRLAVSDAIAVFDSTYGSLRLTERVFTELSGLIDRLEAAARAVGDEAQTGLSLQTVEHTRRWFEGLAPSNEPEAVVAAITADGWLRVLRRGSVVARRDSQGVLRDIRIVAPEITTFDDEPARLHYRYESLHTAGGTIGVRYLQDASIERVGDDWSEELWNPTSGEFRDLEDEDVNSPAPAP
jgi:DEAD/DEAH box helicase domain-containing protein